MTMMINNEPWFVGKDVAMMLGITLIDHVEADDKIDGVAIRDSIGREDKTTFVISESGSMVL